MSVLDAPLLRAAVLPSASNGLGGASWVMIDKLTTVRRSHFERRIGRLTARDEYASCRDTVLGH
ncbi:MAG TPA: hypothetical protein PKE40_01650 [Arachnia sp.]|nr:hypothetical protein [Arachnia sp.]HMT85033.1 hypothetical protein [Arachnia sp.]